MVPQPNESSPLEPDRLGSLPPELYQMVLDNLDAGGVLALRSTSKSHKSATKDSFRTARARAFFSRLMGPDYRREATAWDTEDNFCAMLRKCKAMPRWLEPPSDDEEDYWTPLRKIICYLTTQTLQPDTAHDLLFTHARSVGVFDLRQLILSVRAISILQEQSCWKADGKHSVTCEYSDDDFQLATVLHRSKAVLSSMMRTGLSCRSLNIHWVSPILLRLDSNDILKDKRRLRICLQHTREISLALHWNTWDNTTPAEERTQVRPKAVTDFLMCAPKLQKLEIVINHRRNRPDSHEQGSWTFDADFAEELDLLFQGLSGLEDLETFKFEGTVCFEQVKVKDEGLIDFLTNSTNIRCLDLESVMLATNIWPGVFHAISLMPRLEEMEFDDWWRTSDSGVPECLRAARVLASGGSEVEVRGGYPMILNGREVIKNNFNRIQELVYWYAA